jgi:hypothetical protein
MTTELQEIRPDQRPVTRALIQEFEAAMRKLPPKLQVDPSSFTVRHHFAPGIYMRELHIPATMITTGKIHKYACLSILAKGRRSTLVDNQIVTVEAPHIHLSPPGMKRVSYTHEDSVWITVHTTNLTDVNEIERELVCDTEEEYLAFCAKENRECLS